MSHSFACRAASLLLLASASVAQIAPGNLIVVRVGDGAFGLTPFAPSRGMQFTIGS